MRKQFQELSGNVAKGQWCLVVMLGELGVGLGSPAGRAALSQPQPRADVVHTEYNTAFESWVCGPCHPVLQCGVALAVVESLCLQWPGSLWRHEVQEHFPFSECSPCVHVTQL